ncbi:MAG: TraR/DksA C4-type zinc finger protein [Deltaproteobacteria bacterium]|nr:TraR/DksA C4-type zinc finger protein [Deltaproteobacteria bacterium]
MNKKILQHFRKRLTDQLDELHDKNSQKRVTTLAESEQAPDFTDQATLETDIDMNIHIKERDSKLILKIKQALERIENGTFGICETCGEEISEARLEARPVTTECIDCKREQENQEKLRGN